MGGPYHGGVSIRLKIGLGFVVLIILLTSVTSWWGARTLGITLEASDQERLAALRQTVLDTWAQEAARLATMTAAMATAFAGVDAGGREHETAVGMAEKFKRHLNADWLEIIRGSRSLLYPAIELEQGALSPCAWPVRLTRRGPLSNGGFLVTVRPLPGATDSLIVARRAVPPAVPLVCLWDEQGLLVGDPEDFPQDSLTQYQAPPVTLQRLQKGKLYRVRAERVGEGGPWLMVGYEADVATLTRTNVNDLMVQLAILEVLGLSVLGFFLGGHLFRPLEDLRAGMERVATGHWQQIPEGEGDEVGMVAQSFNRMVKELSQAQERLIEVQRELMLKEKMAVLGRFSAGMAHEINNPLGTILVTAGLARENAERSGAVDREDLETIIEETKRCRQIVDSLMAYARNRTPELKPLFLPELVRGALTRLQFPGQRSCTLVTPFAFPEVIVLADQLSIEQVLRNLLDNAADAVADVKESPTVRLEAEETPDGWLILSVLDNGPGLPEGEDHLFEPFFTTKAKGTGLGLAISQSIILGHGGRIWADRTPDGWTRFRFSLKKGHANNLPDIAKPEKH